MLRILISLAFALWLADPAFADRSAWPLPPCEPGQIASASPAPTLDDSRSLWNVPFIPALVTLSAGYVVELDRDRHPVIVCVTPDSDAYLAYPGAVALADLVFATPRRPNLTTKAGRYLVRLSDTLGIGLIAPPPSLPILPPCTPPLHGPPVADAPKPATRVAPVYPDGAQQAEIEGQVTVWLDVYASGTATPRCISESYPPGWFEDSAVTALSQWHFAPTGIGAHLYKVTVKFKLGP